MEYDRDGEVEEARQVGLGGCRYCCGERCMYVCMYILGKECGVCVLGIWDGVGFGFGFGFVCYMWCVCVCVI